MHLHMVSAEMNRMKSNAVCRSLFPKLRGSGEGPYDEPPGHQGNGTDKVAPVAR
jgi:hypothetical protein